MISMISMISRKLGPGSRVRAAHFCATLTSIQSNITPTLDAFLIASESGGLINGSPLAIAAV
jgi:hypothetical protein